MGGGNLNFKKTWHPETFRNQEKLWKAEQKSLEEKKKLDLWKKEIDKERQNEELQRLYEESGVVKKRPQRLDWMYASSQAQAQSLSEEYLLGKRRLDSTIMKDDSNTLGKFLDTTQNVPTTSPSSMLSSATSIDELEQQARLREDPMMKIKLKEKATLDSILNNPLKLKQLKELYEKKMREKSGSSRESNTKKNKDEGAQNDTSPTHRHRPAHDHRSEHRRDGQKNTEVKNDGNLNDRELSSKRDREDLDYRRSHRDRRERKDRQDDADYKSSSRYSDDKHRKHGAKDTDVRHDSKSYPMADAEKSDEKRIDDQEKLKLMMDDGKWAEKERNKRIEHSHYKEKEESRYNEELQRSNKSGERASFLANMQKSTFSSNVGSLEDRVKRHVHYLKKE